MSSDRLYGITMQEKGVSTLVSVNLVESELEARQRQAGQILDRLLYRGGKHT